MLTVRVARQHSEKQRWKGKFNYTRPKRRTFGRRICNQPQTATSATPRDAATNSKTKSLHFTILRIRHTQRPHLLLTTPHFDKTFNWQPTAARLEFGRRWLSRSYTSRILHTLHLHVPTSREE